MGQAGCLFAEPMFSRAGMEERWRKPRESRGSVWTQLNESCPCHIPLGTCSLQLPWSWYVWVARGQGYTYGRWESLWEGFKAADVPPELTEHVLSRTSRLVICLLQEAGFLTEGPTSITLNLQNKAGIIVKSRPTEPYEKKNMKLQKSL